MNFKMWQQKQRQHTRLVATPIESVTKMLSPVIAVQLMTNTMPLPSVGKYKGLSAHKTSKPYINIQQLV